jgi:protein O-GlcNAc transferase
MYMGGQDAQNCGSSEDQKLERLEEMQFPALNKHAYNASAELADAVRLHRAGDLEKAVLIYQRILARDRQNPDALHLLGVIATQEGRFEEARDLINRAIGLDPDQAAYYSNLGNAYRANRLLSEAVHCYRKALELKPDYADANYNLGRALIDLRELNLALQHLRSATLHNPNLVEAYLLSGGIYEETGKPEQAITCYRRALALQPDCSDTCIRLGSAYQKINEHLSAIPYFAQALAANLDDKHRIFNNLGISYQHTGNHKEAIRCFKTAATLKPDYAVAYYNLGLNLQLNGELDESIRVLEQAVRLKPDYGEALNLLVHQLQRTCDWSKFETHAARMADLTQSALKRKDRTCEAVYTNICTHPDPAFNYSLARSRSRDIATSAPGMPAPLVHHKPRAADDRIVLGYFSADFRNHPVAHLIRGVLNLHDRKQFKVCGYSYGRKDGSRYRSQIEHDCDHFVDIHGASSREIASRIYADKVNILIDLMGHTAGSRLDVCAVRPAPIQVTYLGFPGTTGAEFMDYIITDKIVSPPEHEPYYSEKLVYLPNCYQANNNAQEIAEDVQGRSDWELPEAGIVFSSFNQPVKIESVMFNCWMRVLQRVPASVLWLLADNPAAEDNLRRAARDCGVDSKRLIFAPKISKEKHLARMGLADLALDTRIYNGHTTTSDSLWAGVPVVTLIGTHFASRVSASILSAIGLPDLIARTLTEYEDLAVRLATDRGGLNQLKQKLALKRQSEPLFDTPLFTRHLEQAYKIIWQLVIAGEKPRHIDVASTLAAGANNNYSGGLQFVRSIKRGVTRL